MKCDKCKHTLPEDSEFCQYCGHKITGFTVSEIIEDSSDNEESISSQDALKSIMAAQVIATKEAYDANGQSQSNQESDCDFGLTPEKPIYTLARKSVDGEIEYLSKLRTPNGEKVKWNRHGSTSVDGINGMVDIYDIYLLSGQKYTTIYINMYGAKASTKMPTGFGVQKTQPIKKIKEQKNSKLDIINIFVLLLPIILSGVGIDTSYYGEEIFASILVIGTITLVLKIIAVTKFKNNIIFTSIISSALLIMTICSLATEDDEIGPWVCILSLYIFIFELCKLIKFCIEKYHGSQSYKMKCYKKINLINEYREKGVITQEEFEETRKQMISKIR